MMGLDGVGLLQAFGWVGSDWEWESTGADHPIEGEEGL